MKLRQVVSLFFSVLLPVCAADAAEGLLLRLVVPKGTLCVSDGKITAEIELRNFSGKPVVVNAAAIGGSVDALALYSTEHNTPRFGSFNIMGDSIKQQAPRLITLNPSESHRIEGTFGLNDAFFHEAGFYQIRTDYFATDARDPRRKQNVSSNWVIILLELCSETPKNK